MKIQISSGNHWGDVNELFVFVFKNLLTMPSNVLPLGLKQTFPPIIWIFTEGEGDGIESRLPFKIFSTLLVSGITYQFHFQDYKALRFGKLQSAALTMSTTFSLKRF